MTAQIHDVIFFDDKLWTIVLNRGKEVINPEKDFGLIIRPMHTACERGYYLEYTILDKRLYLTKMTVRDARHRYPPISGVQAKLHYYGSPDGELTESGAYVYEDLRLPVLFSGTIWIARDFIQEMYIYGGYQRPAAFRTVYELLIENGTFTNINDLSEEMERRRQAGCIPLGGLLRWLTKLFS